MGDSDNIRRGTQQPVKPMLKAVNSWIISVNVYFTFGIATYHKQNQS